MLLTDRDTFSYTAHQIARDKPYYVVLAANWTAARMMLADKMPCYCRLILTPEDVPPKDSHASIEILVCSTFQQAAHGRQADILAAMIQEGYDLPPTIRADLTAVNDTVLALHQQLAAQNLMYLRKHAPGRLASLLREFGQ